MTTHNGNPANHLFAYSVEEYDAGNGKKGRSWTRIGAAFPHKEGPGFNIELRSIPLGTIVMIPHLMTIAITLGLMGLTGIRLDSTTTMVVCAPR